MGAGFSRGTATAERRKIGGEMGGEYAGDAAALAESPRRRVLCARYQVYTRAIYGPPIVPPGPCKSRPPSLQNPAARATGAADRDSHSQHHRRQAPQSGRHSTADTAPQPQQPASTTAPQPPQHTTEPQQDGKPGPTATATGPTMTTGQARRAVGTPGGGCEVCGFGTAKYF